MRHPLLTLALCWITVSWLAGFARAQDERPLDVTGWLSEKEPFDGVLKKSRHKIHEVELKKGELYLFELRSEDFDAYLRLEDEAGKPILANDDAFPGTRNARIGFVPLKGGKYRAVVTTFEGGQTGEYRLVVGKLERKGEPEVVRGKLTDDSRKVQGRHFDLRNVEWKVGEFHLLELESDDFDPLLIVRDAKKRELARDDDGGGGLNSRLLLSAQEGTHVLQLVALEPGTKGSYVLRMQRCVPAQALEPSDRERWAEEGRKLLGAGDRHYLAGRVKEALPVYEQLVALAEKLHPPGRYPQGHIRVGTAQNRLGAAWNGLARPEKSLPCFERALGIYERLQPDDRVTIASGVLNVGVALRALGRPDLSRSERAVTLFEGLYPKQDHPLLAHSLEHLGAVFHDLGQPAKALPLYERALAMLERLHPNQDHPELVPTLLNLGEVLRVLGQPEKAVPHYERALGMCERLYPKQDHPHLAASLHNLGAGLTDLGHAAKALPHAKRALTMRERLYLKQDHPDLASSLLHLGEVFQVLGQPAQALPYSERAAAMYERRYPKQDHPDLANSLRELAESLGAVGQPARALPHIERALAMYERLFPTQDHPGRANSLRNLGVVLWSLGQPEKSLPFIERALAMHERLFPKRDHPDLAESLEDLAMVLWSLGQPAKALPYAERALGMYERLYRKQDHSFLAASLRTLGVVRYTLGQTEQALPYAQRAVAMYERLFPEQDHVHLLASLHNLGGILLQRGQAAQARPHVERALAMYERLFAEQDHPDLVNTLHHVAVMLDALGQSPQAFRYVERGYARQRRCLEQNLVLEGQALNLAADLERSRSLYLSVADRAEFRPEWYAHLFAGKAALTRVLQQRQAAARVARSQSKELETTWKELIEVRSHLAGLLQNPMGEDKTNQELLSKLNQRKEQLQRRLHEKLPELERYQKLAQMGPAHLAEQLPAQAAFIDLMRYHHVERNQQAQERYVAFVLPHKGQAVRVELGPIQPINLAVDLWRQAVTGWDAKLQPEALGELEARASKHAEEIHRLVWAKIASHLPDGTRLVYLASEGNLSRLPFVALPGSKKDTLLLEELTIAYVPHGPYLLEQLVYPQPIPQAPGKALVVGGVAHQPPGAKGAPWSFLKWSDAEADDLQAVGRERDLVRLTGAQPSTSKLRELLPQVRYAHLATHGFFKEAELAREKQRLRDVVKNWQFTPDRSVIVVGRESPLAYNGLVLAGANEPEKAGQDGGLLSAEVIIELPLEKLHLAVLSACETGLGELTGAEGVQGLQRAFHLAGCPNVVASLWQVHDQATAVLMARFYHELWVNKRSPAEALQQAQLLVYRRPDLVQTLAGTRAAPRVHQQRLQEVLKLDVNIQPAVGGRSPAYLWAAFVLSGPGR